ncbi:8421_t:CDS:2, partial [Gigaspora margarita]
PLSHDLAGIILPHDTFGSYLNEQLKTANNELDKCNFKVAEEILVSVYENTIIDNYPVLVKYVDPKEYYQSRLDEKSVAWIKRHTITCHYITQQKSHGICVASINASNDTTHFSNFLLSILIVGKLISSKMNL